MFPLFSLINNGLFFLTGIAIKAGSALAGLLLELNQDQIVRIAVFVVILIVVWFVLKTVLRVTLRLFAFGCGAILVLGLVLVLLRLFTQ